MIVLDGPAKDSLEAELAKVPEQLRGFTAAAIQLELERAAGVDVTVGEAALKASAASIALEHQVHIERTALRMILKAIATL
jgi:hypothetical protein